MGHTTYLFSDEVLQRTKPRAVNELKTKYTRAARTMGCNACPLNRAQGKLDPRSVDGEGKKVYVIGRAPTQGEQEINKQFSSDIAQRVVSTLSSSGFDLRFDTAVRCTPGRNVAQMEMACCNNYVIDSLNSYDPDAVIVLGREAMTQVFGNIGDIDTWHGRRIPYKLASGKEVWCYPLYHESNMTSEPIRDITSFDLGRVIAAIKTSKIMPKVLAPLEQKITLLKSVDAIKEYLTTLGGYTQVAFDIETTSPNETLLERSVRPYADGRRIISIAFCHADGQGLAEAEAVAFPVQHKRVSADYTSEVLALLYDFFKTSPNTLKIAHNLSYELEWLAHEEVRCGQSKSVFDPDSFLYKGGPWADTMAQAYVLDSRPKALSLNFRTFETYGFQLKALNAHLDMSNLEDESLDEVLRYNALDAFWTLRLYGAQEDKLKARRLESVYNDQVERIMPAVAMQLKGVHIDTDRLEEVHRGFEEDESTQMAFFEEHNLNPDSSKQILTFLRNHSPELEGLPNTKKETLNAYAHLPIVNRVISYRSISKLVKNYTTPMKTGVLVWPDGKIHTNYKTMFVATRRTSSDKPNMQNLPKHVNASNLVRSIISAPKGYKMVSVDYGQIEARVLAMISKDVEFNKSLREHYDIHQEWAERLRKSFPELKDVDPKELRQRTKGAFVFANFYGAGTNKIANTLRVSDVQEVTNLRKIFWKQFSGVKKWQEEILKYYREHGCVRSLTGFVRRGPLSYTETINTPIQTSASDITVRSQSALVNLAYETGNEDLIPAINVHDDLIFYIKEAEVDATLEVIVDKMLSPGFDWISTPLVVEASIGDSWDDMSDYGNYER